MGDTRDPVPVKEAGELDSLLDEPLVVLYKHSPLCGLSDIAAREIREFMEANPAVPVYQVDVIRSRPVSQEVERRLSIRHESPQVFVIRDGEVVWHGSHRSVTAATLETELG